MKKRRVPLSTKVHSPPEWERRRRKQKRAASARRRARKFDQSSSWNEPGFVEAFRVMP